MSTLAIDQGTTSTRALLVDGEGVVRRLHDVAHRQLHPGPGRVEHDPEELVAAVRACLDAAAEIPDLAAVGLANQGESCLGWDAGSGRAVGPVIVWQDDRTRSATDRLRAAGAEPLVMARAGVPLDPYFSASKLAWILRENPQARRLAARGRLRLGTTDAFFRDRLTGRFETDPSTASRTALMNLATLDWDPELCALFGVPVEALPAIRPTTGDLGALAVGARRIPLTASVVDQQASLYGHARHAPGAVKATFGTGAFALAVAAGPVAVGPGGPSATVAWMKAGEPAAFAVEGGVYCAGAAVDWARGLGLFPEAAAAGAFEAPPAIGRGLVFVPALAGLACPHWDRRARGAWLGMGLGARPIDLAQALLEGVALRTAEALDALAAATPLVGPLSIDGGLSANPYFARFLADATGLAVLVADEPELTAVGAAALAAAAAGAPFPLAPRGRTVAPGALPAGAREVFTAAVAATRAFGAAVAGSPERN